MVPPPEESRKKMKKYTLNITAAMLFVEKTKIRFLMLP